jgi:hypothetical protein
MECINNALTAAFMELNKRGPKHNYQFFGKPIQDNEQYGRLISNISDSRENLFCGLMLNLWNEPDGKEYVYSLRIPMEGTKDEKIDIDKYPFFKHEGRIYIQIDRKIFESKDSEVELRKRVVDIIKAVYERYTRFE